MFQLYNLSFDPRQLVNSRAKVRFQLFKVKSALDEVEHSYQVSNQNVNDSSNQLVEITDELSQVKRLLEEKNGSISDTTPIVEIKSALDKLKADIKEFDLRIGVVVSSS